MYDKLNITENHLRILTLFTNGFDNEYYIREVQRLCKISPRTAQMILESLETRGILKSKTKGKIKTYSLSRTPLTRRYLTFTEQYKTIAFLGKNLLITEVIEKIVPLVKGIGLVFGSYAKGMEKKGSDLDIFVAGDYDTSGIKKISTTYGVDVSVKCYPQKTFEREVSRDPLLIEISKNHVVFSGLEKYMSVIMYG